MAKKSKKKTNGVKTEAKEATKGEPKEAEAKPDEAKVATVQNGKAQPIIRAIRVTAEILTAAKAYKKATGVSFYTLGYESISERLIREGFLKKANQ